MKQIFKTILFFVLIAFMITIPIIFSYEYKNSPKCASVKISDEKYESMSTMNLDTKINELKEIVKSTQPISLGKFKLTAYCPCEICCGKWSGGATASGVMPRDNHTIAVDTSIIPFGTKIIINGNTYTAEDTGSAIKGNKIDIYMSDHEKAKQFGVQYTEVFKENF